jgi:membrane protein YqaA with SNARE-associated domain
MFELGQSIVDLFSGLGDLGMLLAITIIIWIDGTAFPTLPEVWMIFIFGVHPGSFMWGATLVMVASLASLLGNFTLYSLVKIAKLPSWVQKAMKKYTNWLILKDERLLILNRFAPLIPYTGAFMAVCNWNLKKCAVYLLVSAVAKFSAYILIFWLSFESLKEEVAPWVSLAIVAIVITASIITSFVYKKKQERGEPARSP